MQPKLRLNQSSRRTIARRFDSLSSPYSFHSRYFIFSSSSFCFPPLRFKFIPIGLLIYLNGKHRAELATVAGRCVNYRLDWIWQLPRSPARERTPSCTRHRLCDIARNTSIMPDLGHRRSSIRIERGGDASANYSYALQTSAAYDLIQQGDIARCVSFYRTAGGLTFRIQF